MAKKLGFADKMFKNIKVENNRPVPEDMLREMNRGSWSHRLLRPVAGAAQGAHGEPGEVRPGDACARPRTIRKSAAIITACLGRAGASRRSSIPARRCSTTPTSAVMDGGGTFRARFGVERNGANAARAKAPISLGRRSRTAIPNSRCGVLKKLGWDKDLTPNELATIEKVAGSPDKTDTVSWSTTFPAASSASR